ncbi:MAG: binding-protein-dependent transport system inner rane component family protein [Rhizobacter sp.]|jgi:tungstate transport system permease protein|nr:binding-protein-dependent transport system inner rane component family protein [Rhizobacter sp.]
MTASSGVWQATGDAFVLLFGGDAGIWAIVWVSLKTSLLALLIAAPLATLAGYALARTHFRGRRVLVLLVQVALSVPTVLIGLLLYLLLSRRGPLGPLDLLFTQGGMVAGQALLGFPVIVAFVLAAVQGADPRLFETARALGATRLRTFATTLHELRFSVCAALAAGFGRVLTEVGSALMIGGNIEGATRTMTTAIALETSKGDFAQGIALGIVLLVVALAVNGLVALMQGREART